MTEEEFSARATPRQTKPLFIGDLVALCKMINYKLHTATTYPIHLYIQARDLAYFKLHFFSGDRLSDLAHIKAAEILRFPNDKGNQYYLIMFSREDTPLWGFPGLRVRGEASQFRHLPCTGVRRL